MSLPLSDLIPYTGDLKVTIQKQLGVLFTEMVVGTQMNHWFWWEQLFLKMPHFSLSLKKNIQVAV